MRFIKWFLIIDVINSTWAYERALPHSYMPTLLQKDVFPNFKLNAEVVLTPSYAHSLPLGIQFKVALFSVFENHFWLVHRSEGISRWRWSSLATASYPKFLSHKYQQLLQHNWYCVTPNKQINLLIYSQWSVWFAHTVFWMLRALNQRVRLRIGQGFDSLKCQFT